MEVWVVEWSYPYDGENNVTVWSNQIDAQRSALREIEDLISNDWDMDDSDASACADDVSDMIKRGQFDEAIRRFNDYQDEYNSDYAQHWFVYSRPLLTGDATEVPVVTPTLYKPSISGATCRGPCGQYNDYAYADRPDGTHLCRQCSTFQHIFGVNKS